MKKQMEPNKSGTEGLQQQELVPQPGKIFPQPGKMFPTNRIYNKTTLRPQ